MRGFLLFAKVKGQYFNGTVLTIFMASKEAVRGECNVKCKDDIKNLNKELLLFLSKFGEALIGGHDLLLRRDIGEFTKYSKGFFYLKKKICISSMYIQYTHFLIIFKALFIIYLLSISF